jgi:hypothetical protein
MFRQFRIAILCATVLTVCFGTPIGAETQSPAAQRQEHERKYETKLKELGKNMDELAAEASKKEERLRAEVNRLYEEFKKKQKHAGKELDELRNSTNEKWDKTKVNIDKTLEDLNGVYDRAKDRIKKKDKEEGK